MTSINDLYNEAIKEFPTKESKETSPITSKVIKTSFKPEADVLLPAGKKWSDFFEEQSIDKAKERLREYLADTVSEFVDTNVLSAQTFYQVLQEVIYDNWQYYQRNADINKELLEMIGSTNKQTP